MKKFYYILAGSLLCAACDTKDRTPIPGDRVAFLNFVPALTPDKANQSQSINIPAPIENKEWAQVGGTVNHVLTHVALGDKIEPVWQKDVGLGSNDEQRLLVTPVTDESRVYAMDAQGNVTALSFKTGEEIWKKPTSPEESSHDTLGGGVAVEKGVLYVATAFGDVIALKADTGEEIWRKTGFAPFRAAPSVKDGRIYVQAINNELFALSAEKGDTLWTHSGIPESALLLGGGKVACYADTVIVAYTSGEVHALNSINGQVLWSDTITPVARIDTVTSIPHIRARPVIDDNQVFIISHGGRMTCIDFKTGVRQWQKELGGIRTPVVSGDYLFVLTNMSELVCLDRKSGSVHWVAGLPRIDADEGIIHYAGPIMAGNTLIVTSSKGEVVRINPTNGEVANTIKVGNPIFLAPIVAQQTLFVMTDAAVIHALR